MLGGSEQSVTAEKNPFKGGRFCNCGSVNTVLTNEKV